MMSNLAVDTGQMEFKFMANLPVVEGRYDIHMRAGHVHWVASRVNDPTVNRPVFQEFILNNGGAFDAPTLLPPNRVDQFLELMDTLPLEDQERIDLKKLEKQYYHAERFNQILYTSQQLPEGAFFSSLSMRTPDGNLFESRINVLPNENKLDFQFKMNNERDMTQKEFQALIHTFQDAYETAYTQDKVHLFQNVFDLYVHSHTPHRVIASKPFDLLCLALDSKQPEIK